LPLFEWLFEQLIYWTIWFLLWGGDLIGGGVL
jgi:hypothetical protein